MHNLDGDLMILPEPVTIVFLAGDWILLNLLNLNLHIIILANLAVLIKLSFPLSKRLWIEGWVSLNACGVECSLVYGFVI